jgi:hypothetical protein
VLGISWSRNEKEVSTIEMSGRISARRIDPDNIATVLRDMPPDARPRLLESKHRLAYIGTDLIMDDMTCTITLKDTMNSKLSGALTKAITAQATSPDTITMVGRSQDSQRSGAFTLRSSGPVVIASVAFPYEAVGTPGHLAGERPALTPPSLPAYKVAGKRR